MKAIGRYKSVAKNLDTGETVLSFAVSDISTTQLEEIAKEEKLEITAAKWRQHRSKDANALLWACIGDIAKALNPPADKWEIYLQMLKRYGRYTYVVVRPEAAERLRQVWRETEIVGDISVNGQKAVQMLCYYGSSTYDSKEMAVLLDGVVSEMQELGLQPPPSGELKRLIAEMEKRNAQTNT